MQMASCTALRFPERIDWRVTVVRQFSLVACSSRGPPIRTKVNRARVDCAMSNVNANIRRHLRTTAHDSGGLNVSGYQRRRGNFSRVRQPQWGIGPRLVCQYREKISQASAAVHQRLIQPLFNEFGLRPPKCLRLLALPREARKLYKKRQILKSLGITRCIELQRVSRSIPKHHPMPRGKVRTPRASSAAGHDTYMIFGVRSAGTRSTFSTSTPPRRPPL